MSEQRSRHSGQRRDDEDRPDEPDQAKEGKPNRKDSGITDEMLEDIDRALKAQCGFEEGEDVSDQQFEKRAAKVVDENIQKGGQ